MGRVLHLGPSWHGLSFMWAELSCTPFTYMPNRKLAQIGFFFFFLVSVANNSANATGNFN